MPIHDWTRVDAGLFHDFHQLWSVEIVRTLNAGLLPKGHYALVEQRTGAPEPDVIAVETGRGRKAKPEPGGATAVAEPLRTRMVRTIDTEAIAYAKKANRITVRHHLGRWSPSSRLCRRGTRAARPR